jgi:hypothetical protein
VKAERHLVERGGGEAGGALTNPVPLRCDTGAMAGRRGWDVAILGTVCAGVQALGLAVFAVAGLGYALLALRGDLSDSSNQFAGLGEVLGAFAFVLFGTSALMIWLPARRVPERNGVAATVLVLAELVTAVPVAVAATQIRSALLRAAGWGYVALAVVVVATTILTWSGSRRASEG